MEDDEDDEESEDDAPPRGRAPTKSSLRTRPQSPPPSHCGNDDSRRSRAQSVGRARFDEPSSSREIMQMTIQSANVLTVLDVNNHQHAHMKVDLLLLLMETPTHLWILCKAVVFWLLYCSIFKRK